MPDFNIVRAPEVRVRPGALHAELLPRSLDAVYAPLASAARAPGQRDDDAPDLVSAPYEYWRLLHLRERIGLPSANGDVRPADLFLWSLDPAPHPAATRFGGAPYLPRDQPWPQRRGKDGCFLAQLCFADSRDLVPFAPKDVLLVFTFDLDGVTSWDDDCYGFVWVDVDDAAPHQAAADVPPGGTWAELALHGVRVRSFDEPSLVPRIRKEKDLPAVHIGNGTKIGGAATDRQSIEPPATPRDWRFLGQIAAFHPRSGVPFPVFGHPAPLGAELEDREPLMRGPGDGVLCLYLDADGEVQIYFSAG